ncbi:hypothetical protein JCM10908_006271 [Rhodotorula pacifica]|uniref:uncharacterized protein n=1 Tax=Rhodotorula pacifica TaxID=1495444 RepID=UPI003181C817
MAQAAELDSRPASAEPDELMRSVDEEQPSSAAVKHEEDQEQQHYTSNGTRHAEHKQLDRLNGPAQHVKQDAEDRKPFPAAAADRSDEADQDDYAEEDEDEKPQRPTSAEIAKKEIARIDDLLTKLYRTIAEMERESPEPQPQPAHATRPAFSKRPSPSSSAYDEDYEGPGGGSTSRGGKRQRRVTTEEDKLLKQAASRFMHTERGYLHPETATRLFTKKKRAPNPGDPPEDGVELFDLFIDTIGGIDQLTSEVCKKFPRMMSIARAETTNRLRTFAPGILGVSQGTLNDGSHATTVQLRMHDSLGWTYLDPRTKDGYLRSPRLIEACSLVLYGPTSIGKKGALKRSTSHEHHKGAIWQLRSIPVPLVALAVTIMRSVVMGEKSFRLTGAPPEAVKAREIYDKVRDYLNDSADGPEILAWLTKELIPPRPKSEDEGAEGTIEGGDEDEVMAAEEEEAEQAEESKPKTKQRGSRAGSSPLKRGTTSGLSHSFSATESKAQPTEGEDQLEED